MTASPAPSLHSLGPDDIASLTGPTRLWVLELDAEYDNIQVSGPADVVFVDRMVESATTGGCYRDESRGDVRDLLGNVFMLTAEEHSLALFADEASFEAGVVALAKDWALAEQCPVSLIRLAAKFVPGGSVDILGI